MIKRNQFWSSKVLVRCARGYKENIFATNFPVINISYKILLSGKSTLISNLWNSIITQVKRTFQPNLIKLENKDLPYHQMSTMKLHLSKNLYLSQMSQNGQTLFKKHLLQDFLSVSDQFGALCINVLRKLYWMLQR